MANELRLRARFASWRFDGSVNGAVASSTDHPHFPARQLSISGFPTGRNHTSHAPLSEHSIVHSSVPSTPPSNMAFVTAAHCSCDWRIKDWKLAKRAGPSAKNSWSEASFVGDTSEPGARDSYEEGRKAWLRSRLSQPLRLAAATANATTQRTHFLSAGSPISEVSFSLRSEPGLELINPVREPAGSAGPLIDGEPNSASPNS